MCDTQFSEEVGRVLCSELTGGQSTLNVQWRLSYLYDSQVYGWNNPFMTKDYWRQTYVCRGTETALYQCTQRYNYFWSLCAKRWDYVFLRCSPNNLAPQLHYWGNLRYANPRLEYSYLNTGSLSLPDGSWLGTSAQLGGVLIPSSTLDYVDIFGSLVYSTRPSTCCTVTYEY